MTATKPPLPSNSFCILPWMHIFADEKGVMYPCCRSVGSQLPNREATGQGRIYKIQDLDGIEEGWNSAYMRKLRQEMLVGERPLPCARCYMYEDLGMKSHRQSQNEQYVEQIDALVSRTSQDGRVPLELQSVDIRLGNLCNLRCRMCSPQSSKALIQEWADLHGVKATHPYFEELRQLDWFAQPAFWEIFEKYSTKIERLHFAGGEPLLIAPMFDFLERLIKLDRARNIMISYNTNLTVLPQRVFELWPHFRTVRITVSLDGFGDINSFIRYPSHWPTIDQNLKSLDREVDNLNCTGGLAFNTTVQIYNIFHLDKFIDYTADSFINFEAPNLSILSFPEHLSIRILPQEIKDQLSIKLKTFSQTRVEQWQEKWGKEQAETLAAAIDGIVEHMMSGDSQHLIPEFLRWCQHQDQFRKQNVLDVVAELAPLFK
ncbi:MAG: twitch domain-containing radical SAM protein [Blastocatellia bacterium]|nr:twitch domain-containing radical SAM protein [Blastocatellia bacterium]